MKKNTHLGITEGETLDFGKKNPIFSSSKWKKPLFFGKKTTKIDYFFCNFFFLKKIIFEKTKKKNAQILDWFLYRRQMGLRERKTRIKIGYFNIKQRSIFLDNFCPKINLGFDFPLHLQSKTQKNIKKMRKKTTIFKDFVLFWKRRKSKKCKKRCHFYT